MQIDETTVSNIDSYPTGLMYIYVLPKAFIFTGSISAAIVDPTKKEPFGIPSATDVWT